MHAEIQHQQFLHSLILTFLSVSGHEVLIGPFFLRVSVVLPPARVRVVLGCRNFFDQGGFVPLRLT